MRQVIEGDCRALLAALPAASVDVCVTSPPYWWLRDYGIAPSDWADGWRGVLGLEPTVEQFVAHLVEVFDLVRRVLRPAGVLWVNLGDSYAASGGSGGPKQSQRVYGRSPTPKGLRPGNLIGAPWRFALAMQAAGWLLRSDAIWAKRSPIPESIKGWRWERCRRKVGTVAAWADCPGCEKCQATDGLVLRRAGWRPTKAHEYVFQFAQQAQYFGDLLGAHEPTTGGAHLRRAAAGDVQPNPKAAEAGSGIRANVSFQAAVNDLLETRNPRDVWLLSSEPVRDAHFATYPRELVRRCLRGCYSPAGYCAACGAPVVRIVGRARLATRPGNQTKVGRVSRHENSPYTRHNGTIFGNRDPQRHVTAHVTLGWRATCTCGAATRPAVVLDPFCGSGTTGAVAAELGLDFVGLELSVDYAAIARRRIAEAEQRAAAGPPQRRPARPAQAPDDPQRWLGFEEAETGAA